MKKHCLIIFLVFFYGCGQGQIKEAIDLQTDNNILGQQQLELIFEKAKLFPDQTQISIALIKDGKAIFYGIRRQNDTIITVDNHKNVFEIGSISKVFTTTLLSNLVFEETVRLDNNINDYLDFPLRNKTKITFKQLATHTSGLPRLPTNLNLAVVDPANPYKAYDEVKLRKYLSESLELAHKPGEKSEYSNLGVGLLGYVLGKIDGTSYEDMLQTRIFSKYRMKRSTTDRCKIMTHLIKGLNEQGEEVPNWDLSVLMGAGGILSATEDLSKFALAQFDTANTELELTRTSFFKVDDNYEMGLGWSIIKTDVGEIWNWHNGGTGGYTSSIIINTGSKKGIIVLSNVSAFSKITNNVTDLSHELMKTL